DTGKTLTRWPVFVDHFNMLYAGIPLKVLQSLMGHKSISSTEVYTKVFALDVAARHRVQFAMPESDAVSMLKRIP
ncbi:phage integrase family protein, partial [Escherichia coli]|nr:phage integrase family protein [Escherichia coli]